jgi:hypothetical protein
MHASKIRNGNGNGSPHRKQQQIKQIRFRIFIIKIRVFYEYWESEWESFRTRLISLICAAAMVNSENPGMRRFMTDLASSGMLIESLEDKST